MSLFGVILVRIFPHSDWIRRDGEIHKIHSISSYSVQMRENADQNNPECRHLCSVFHGYAEKYKMFIFNCIHWNINPFFFFAKINGSVVSWGVVSFDSFGPDLVTFPYFRTIFFWRYRTWSQYFQSHLNQCFLVYLLPNYDDNKSGDTVISKDLL